MCVSIAASLQILLMSVLLTMGAVSTHAQTLVVPSLAPVIQALLWPPMAGTAMVSLNSDIVSLLGKHSPHIHSLTHPLRYE